MKIHRQYTSLSTEGSMVTESKDLNEIWPTGRILRPSVLMERYTNYALYNTDCNCESFWDLGTYNITLFFSEIWIFKLLFSVILISVEYIYQFIIFQDK